MPHVSEVECRLPRSAPRGYSYIEADLYYCTSVDCVAPLLEGVDCAPGYVGIPKIRQCKVDERKRSMHATLAGCVLSQQNTDLSTSSTSVIPTLTPSKTPTNPLPHVSTECPNDIQTQSDCDQYCAETCLNSEECSQIPSILRRNRYDIVHGSAAVGFVINEECTCLSFLQEELPGMNGTACLMQLDMGKIEDEDDKKLLGVHHTIWWFILFFFCGWCLFCYLLCIYCKAREHMVKDGKMVEEILLDPNHRPSVGGTKLSTDGEYF